jgi:hypothetical protein
MLDRTCSVIAALGVLLIAREARAETFAIDPSGDLPAAIAMLAPGDELVLAGGTYNVDQLFVISVSGTADQPILIRAADGEIPILTRPDANQNIVNVEGSYLTFRGIELTGGSRGIRLSDVDHVTIESCHVHHTGGNAISANDAGADYDGIVIRRTEIHDTGAEGEGLYLGCNDNGCQFHDATIEQNWIHDLTGPTVSQGDGIEIKEGSYGNVVRDNVIHDTAYPCITTYSTVGNGPANVIERNLMWGCGDHGIQSAADAIIRNNIILGAAADGIHNQPHQSGAPANLVISHNTVIKASGDAIRSDGIVGSVVIANNAIYAQSGNAVRAAGDLAGLVVAGNVGIGSLVGVSSGFTAGGDLTTDFVAASFSGATPNDVFPAPGSPLVGTADAAHLALDDFNATDRAGQLDVGAYRFDEGGNPGWTLQPGFKDAPSGGEGGGGAGAGAGGSGSGTGGGLASGGGSASGGGLDSGAGSTNGAGAGDALGDDGGEDGGCGCRIAEPAGGAHALGLCAALALLLARRRRR